MLLFSTECLNGLLMQLEYIGNTSHAPLPSQPASHLCVRTATSHCRTTQRDYEPYPPPPPHPCTTTGKLSLIDHRLVVMLCLNAKKKKKLWSLDKIVG